MADKEFDSAVADYNEIPVFIKDQLKEEFVEFFSDIIDRVKVTDVNYIGDTSYSCNTYKFDVYFNIVSKYSYNSDSSEEDELDLMVTWYVNYYDDDEIVISKPYLYKPNSSGHYDTELRIASLYKAIFQER